jgi:predicted dehydrogenase
MGTKKELKIAIVGTGEVMRTFHMPAWAKNKYAKVTSICDVNEKSAKEAASSWHIPNYYASFEKLLANETPDIVDICTPPNTHASMLITAFDRRLNVLVEKPLVMNFKDYYEIASAYHKSSKTFNAMVMHNWLHQSLIPSIYSAVRNKDVGDILRMEVNILSSEKDPMISNSKHWCHALPGGRFGECLMHPIYIMQHLVGNLEVTDLQVAKKGRYPWVVYDELSVSFKSDKGSMGNIYVSFNSPCNDYPTITIYGTKKTIYFYNSNLVMLPSRSSSEIAKGLTSFRQMGQIAKSLAIHGSRVLTGRRKTGHRLIIDDYTEKIITGVEPSFTFDNALASTKIFLDVLERLPQK